MNRDRLLRDVALRCEEPLGIVEQIVEATWAAILDALRDGEAVTIERVGEFYRHRIAAGTRPDPLTGAPVQRPAYNQIHFRPAHAWRREVNNGSTPGREVTDG